MVTQPLTAVKRGNTHSDITMDWSHRGSRPQAQYEAVLAHFRRHPAAWVCTNPFAMDRPGQQYKCSFHLSYFDLEGRMCSIWVTPSGKVQFTMEPASAVFAAEALLVVRQYGLFRGGE